MKRLLLYSVLLSSAISWAYENTTLNISACGGRMESSRFTNVGSIVPVGGSTTFTGLFCNHSGFAAGFILQPQTAFSGLPDEWNPDNDFDGLMDGEEIVAGSSLYKIDTDADGLSDFDEVRIHGSNPTQGDSDADGMNDLNELIAGTSPTNETSILAVECIIQPDGERLVSWFGVQGRSYIFQYADSLGTDNWQSYPFEVTGFDVAIAFLDSSTAPERFYRVKVRNTEENGPVL
ncbi:MAG: hypothetical protein KAU94_06100 [Verrucomicrobia bacterium]|nr:hypothetical protein [Verrucomicrobiota bacterium]